MLIHAPFVLPVLVLQIINKVKLEGDAWLEDMDPNSLQV
jgi:hypothetical protein